MRVFVSRQLDRAAATTSTAATEMGSARIERASDRSQRPRIDHYPTSPQCTEWESNPRRVRGKDAGYHYLTHTRRRPQSGQPESNRPQVTLQVTSPPAVTCPGTLPRDFDISPGSDAGVASRPPDQMDGHGIEPCSQPCQGCILASGQSVRSAVDPTGVEPVTSTL